MAVGLERRKHTSDTSRSRLRRQLRVRKKISGTPERPRLVVTRSAKHIVAQVIDDVAGRTLVSASTMESEARAAAGNKTEKAREVGARVAQRAKEAGIERIVFDRAGRKYAGRLAALAEGARESGLEF